MRNLSLYNVTLDPLLSFVNVSYTNNPRLLARITGQTRTASCTGPLNARLPRLTSLPTLDDKQVLNIPDVLALKAVFQATCTPRMRI